MMSRGEHRECDVVGRETPSTMMSEERDPFYEDGIREGPNLLSQVIFIDIAHLNTTVINIRVETKRLAWQNRKEQVNTFNKIKVVRIQTETKNSSDGERRGLLMGC